MSAAVLNLICLTLFDRRAGDQPDKIIAVAYEHYVTIAHFADMAAILNSIVLNVHYGMLRGQINMYLPPEHPI